MPVVTPFLALAALPVAFVLGFSFNPIEFSWAVRHGLKPMPEKVRRGAAVISRYANFLGDALIVSFVIVLMLRNSVPAARVGLHLENWKTNLLIGTASGILLILLQGLITRSTHPRTPGPFAYHAGRGSVLLWLLIFVVGAFSEELWIAFCLVALMASGLAMPLSVAITVAIFGGVHYGYRFGGVIAVALKGTVSALLFLHFRSLVVVFFFHFLGNIGSLYWARRLMIR